MTPAAPLAGDRSQPFGEISPLPSVQHLVEHGFALHWLRVRSKAPVEDAWSSAPFASVADLQASYRLGFNVGVRLGEPSRVGAYYLHLLDMDVRKVEAFADARAALLRLCPGADELPIVASGSGGASRHFYFLSDRPYRSKKLVHSGVKFTDAAGKQHWTWEIELFGTGKQAAMPPSIHPDTGREYVWEREFDFDLLDLDLGPVIPASIIEGWGAHDGSTQAEDSDDLLAYRLQQPMGLTPEKIADTLKWLPLDTHCDDHEGWVQVGMALHHEFEGAETGLAIWRDFSRQSARFQEGDCEKRWPSFKVKAKPVRMATLAKAAGVAKVAADHGLTRTAANEFGEDDLLGDDAEGEGEAADEAEQDLLDDTMPRQIDWLSKLDLNEQGAVKPTLHNIRLIITHDPRTAGVARLNQFTQEVVQRGMPAAKPGRSPKGILQLGGPVWKLRDAVNGDLWGDQKDNAVRAVIEAPTRQGGYAIKVSDRDLRAAIDIAAQEAPFHPVREYLEAQTWDGVERVDRLFVDYLGAPDTAYSRAVARLTLLGAVARVYEPGHKFDFAPILEGPQGARKSTFIKILAKHWFTELQGDFGDRRKMVERMQGAWICELSELVGFSKAEVQELKAFVSATADKDRLAYARRAQEFLRQCIFVGSTNEAEYLRDATGGRRFWPVRCDVAAIDTDGLAKNVDQIWAEARTMYRAMRADQPGGTLPLYISDPTALAEAELNQETRREESVEEGLAGVIEAWLDRPLPEDFDDEDDLIGSPTRFRDQTYQVQVWTECLGNSKSNYTAHNRAQLGRAMRLISGWEIVGPRRTKDGRQRVYRRIGSDV